MKGPPQVHPRSVRGQRKLARRRLTGSRFIHGRSLHSAGQAGHAGAARCPGVAAQHEAPRRQPARFRPRPRRYPGTSRVLATARGSRGPSGPDRRPASDLLGLAGTVGHRAPRSQRFGEPLTAASSPERSDHPDRVHDRGRCPLYVRAQLDTVGLSWTQRDLAGLKATAREAGKTQLTGYFRRWWQVLGSNQRRLSRRFYRPRIPTHRNSR